MEEEDGERGGMGDSYSGQTRAEVGEEGTDSRALGHTTGWTPEPTPSMLAQCVSPDRLDGSGQGSLD